MSNQAKAKELLQRVMEDDEFRAFLESDPIQAFAEYGFEIDPKTAPEKVTLPSNEDIARGIDVLSKKLEETCGLWVFCRT